MKPTQEQIKEFWEGYGFKYLHHSYDNKAVHETPDGDWVYEDGIPPIDLNNLFKYAVPRIEDPSISLYKPVLGGNYWVCVLGHKGCCDNLGTGTGKDPALALFWALWEVIKK